MWTQNKCLDPGTSIMVFACWEAQSKTELTSNLLHLVRVQVLSPRNAYVSSPHNNENTKFISSGSMDRWLFSHTELVQEAYSRKCIARVDIDGYL